MHFIYLIHEFHNLSWITEINELFHDILIYLDAPVYKDEYRSVGKIETLIRFVQEVSIFVPKLLNKVSKGAGKSLNLATK